MSLASRIQDLAAAVRDKFNTITPRVIPAGGSVGQVLTKVNSSDFNTTWTTPASGSGGSSDEDLIFYSMIFGGRR